MAPFSRYRDRQDAGVQLGVALAPYLGAPNLVVLGLPRGGVPVAAEVAKLLHAPLDVVAVQKVGLPGQPELAAGALAWVAGTVTTVQNEAVLADWQSSLHSGTSSSDGPGSAEQAFEAAAAIAQLELIRRDKLYRMRRDPLNVSGRTVVVVDDGLATGATMRAALQGLGRQNPARLVAAAPVSCGPGAETAVALADDVVIPWQAIGLSSVGQAYENFDEITDADVQRLLNIP
ncbi:phosphoribosyl transferase [Arthrobacter gengyunqii]|uniref:Phosphoribosyl transferase n=1 Tax=Arthrobacter gengyunqii TaxID=2886940 RepID=A0A9X1LZL3_9MICC|nr:phosphoribosyltransferase family protein [Arthrobacter gengyunqii]MCC3268578.1 phosphoribosyl transferase [Arthrobacter gengyunqii]UOY95966.1 phosphoribosyl transferase [Arthrobacter gengyunqii]